MKATILNEDVLGVPAGSPYGFVDCPPAGLVEQKYALLVGTAVVLFIEYVPGP